CSRTSTSSRPIIRSWSTTRGSPTSPASALEERGGGRGRFTRCAAGDTGAALVVEVMAYEMASTLMGARAVTVGGRHVEAVELAGDPARRPLVLLHEGLGSVALWRDFPQRLQAATGRRVLAFSRFGHGRSDPPPAPRTPAFFHEEALDVLPELLERLDAGEPLLVGHSDGGS